MLNCNVIHIRSNKQIGGIGTDLLFLRGVSVPETREKKGRYCQGPGCCHRPGTIGGSLQVLNLGTLLEILYPHYLERH